MFEIIMILLVIAAIAALVGMPRLSGMALTGASVLVGIVLVLFLLVLIGFIAVV